MLDTCMRVCSCPHTSTSAQATQPITNETQPIEQLCCAVLFQVPHHTQQVVHASWHTYTAYTVLHACALYRLCHAYRCPCDCSFCCLNQASPFFETCVQNGVNVQCTNGYDAYDDSGYI